MSSCFPLEIVELIFLSLKNDNDVSSLKACALASSYFLSIARSFLFQHVFLLPQARRPAISLAPRSYSLAPTRPSYQYHPGPRSESLSPYLLTPRTEPTVHEAVQFLPESSHAENVCLKLLNVLSMSPTLAHHIKRLTIIDGRLFPCADISTFQIGQADLLSALDWDNPQCYTTRDKLNGPQWFLSTPPNTLHLLFQKLKEAGLREFDLVFPDGPKLSWNSISPDIRGALQFLVAGTSLRRVEIRGMSWDSCPGLRELTGAISQGGVKTLVFRGVKVPNSLSTQALNRGRSPSRRKLYVNVNSNCIRSDSPSHQTEHLIPGNPNSTHTRASVTHTTSPSINLSSRAHTRQADTLDLESLIISTVPGPAGLQDAETLAILNALLRDPESTFSSSLVNPFRLKRLEIPSVDLEYLPDVLYLLRETGAAHGLEHLVLGDRLNLNSVRLKQEIVTDFSDFSNLKNLRLGIYASYSDSNTKPFTNQGFPSYPPHGHFANPAAASSPTAGNPTTLAWLTETLSTLPPSLRHFTLKVTVSSAPVSFIPGKIHSETVGTDQKYEWRLLAERLNWLRSRSPIRVNVNLDMSMNDDHAAGMRFEGARGRTPMGMMLTSKAGFTLGTGDGFGSWGGTTKSGIGCTDVGLGEMRKQFEALFSGSRVGGNNINIGS